MWLAQMAAADTQPVRLRTHSTAAAVTTAGLASFSAVWVSLGVSEMLLLAGGLPVHSNTHVEFSLFGMIDYNYN